MNGISGTIVKCKGENCDQVISEENQCDDYPTYCLWCCNCIGSDGIHKH